MLKSAMLFVVSGPSGVGKGTVIQEILRSRRDLSISISHTSRAPRAGETEGVNYYFVPRAVFEKMIARGEFVEHALVHRNYYGTSRAKLQELLGLGKNVLFEVDVQGGVSLKKKFTQLRSIFILPPSEAELVRRINSRGSETPETLEVRLASMRRELALAQEYDYQVLNGELQDCVSAINKIIDKEVGLRETKVRA